MPHLLLLLALSATPASQGLSAFSGLSFRPVEGEWAEYQLERDGKKEKVRLSVVGSEPEIPNAYWLELDVEQPGQRLRLKLLTVGNPAEPGAIRRIIAALGPGMVMEFPVPPETQPPPPPAPARRGKPQRVKTPAGSFKATPVKLQGATSWISDEVPIFGLVKGSSSDGRIQLVALGTGATSQITGKPQRMGMPLLPGEWAPPKSPAVAPAAPGQKP